MAIDPTFAPAFARWGKTARDGSGEFHLLVFHALDVGAVLDTGLARNQRLLSDLAEQLAMSPEIVRRMLVALAILHDCGKCAGTFQALAPNIAESLGVDIIGMEKYDRRHRGHDRMGQAFLREIAQRHGLGQEAPGSALNELLACFTGHHGIPPARDERLSDFPDAWKPADLDAATALVAVARDVSGWDGILPEQSRLAHVSYTLAGLMTLCDWLGSSDRFAMQTKAEPPEAYFRRVRAGSATSLVEEINPAVFRPPTRPPRQTFARLFAHLGQKTLLQPTPMQVAVEALAKELPPGPLLLVIEDLTGSGKTEAADLFVHALLAEGRASGVYYGLPTIATADAAYRRKRDSLAGIAGTGADLVLAHGRALGAANWSTRAEMEAGDTAPHEWFTSSSKRALLAGAGAGTIDQILAGALRARLSVLRLLGLWNKVLVVDEVHACDSYMVGLLAPLLRQHAAVGGSAVLLSATLPRQLHTYLATAFATGAGFTVPPMTGQPGYPAVTLHHAGGTSAHAVPPLRLPPPVQLRRIDSIVGVHETILGWLAAGRSVLWFRNTVADAIDAERTLAPALEAAGLAAPLLYHARFLPDDRDEIEQRVQNCFGKQADPVARRARLLIATQVAEQSLDLDADELVSDLAPADVLIQRLGRRRRHVRTADGALITDGVDLRPLSAAVILSPDPSVVTDGEWCARLLPRTVWVYEDIGRLWLTAAALFLPGRVRSALTSGLFDPVEDARKFLDIVYPLNEADGAVRELLPLPLRAAFDAANGDSYQERSFAARHALAFQKGWLRDWKGDVVQVDSEGIPKTRLGDIHEVVLLVRRGDVIALMGRDLNRSICRTPRALITAADAVAARERLISAGLIAEHEAARLREREVLLLEQIDIDMWKGFSEKKDAESRTSVQCTYSRRHGFQLLTE